MYSYSDDPKEARRLAMTAAIRATPRKNSVLIPSFEALFRASLAARQQSLEAEDDTMEDGNEVDDNDDENSDAYLFEDGKDLAMFEHLRALGWIRSNGLLMPPLGAALHKIILAKVRTTIEGDFEEEGFFESVQSWCESTVEGWLQDLVGVEAFEKDGWSARLKFCTAECFCLVRIEEIFDIVCDFPDSHPAVSELQTVLERTKMHSQLGDALRASLVRRLNHPGANTSQIIGKLCNISFRSLVGSF